MFYCVNASEHSSNPFGNIVKTAIIRLYSLGNFRQNAPLEINEKLLKSFKNSLHFHIEASFS